ncbi:MAG: hypothetical protein IJT54_05080 [Candidatus Methanomethylophilaceae archaeon]|nr:hypothetical protein [Candidatus Methanomethylophilaceae archaeon]
MKECDKETMNRILEAVRIEQGRYHQRDGKGPSNPTYYDIEKRTGLDTKTVVDYLRFAEKEGWIQGKGFYNRSGGGAKRWKFIKDPNEVDNGKLEVFDPNLKIYQCPECHRLLWGFIMKNDDLTCPCGFVFGKKGCDMERWAIKK